MFNSLLKLFTKNPHPNTRDMGEVSIGYKQIQSNTTQIGQQLMTPETMKEFEIEVYDEDLQDNGRVVMKPRGRQTATAGSAKELVDIFTQCGQKIKIIREITKPTTDVQRLPQTNNTSTSKPTQQFQQPQSQIRTISTEFINPEFINYQSPKYYKIGDIEIKNDNGRIYQRQWVRLTDTEANNLRIINTKTNKIVSMTDKHIEMKRWILVEDHTGEDDLKLLDNKEI